MPPSVQPGRCITYQEIPGKQVYAVVVAIGEEHILVARGTSNSSHGEEKLIHGAIVPRSSAARRWVDPPITRDTYFYEFDIKRIPRGKLDHASLHRMCEGSLWDEIRTAAQRKAVQFPEEL